MPFAGIGVAGGTFSRFSVGQSGLGSDLAAGFG